VGAVAVVVVESITELRKLLLLLLRVAAFRE